MDKSLLEKLVCPVTRSKLRLQADYLVAEQGGLKYPIKDGIPVLLPDQAILPDGVKSLAEFKTRHTQSSN
jgi:uncharacterized protein YbaR (Trm112 family)